jgi:hypothetical protein
MVAKKNILSAENTFAEFSLVFAMATWMVTDNFYSN